MGRQWLGPAPSDAKDLVTKEYADALDTGGSSSYIGGSQIFTSSGTFTVPSGVTSVRVSMCGGGGAGGYNSGGSSGTWRGGGGAGGSVLEEPVAVTPGSTISITIGSGGNGAVSPSTSGTASSFGSHITCGGGGSTTNSSGGIRGSVTGASRNFSGDGYGAGSSSYWKQSGAGGDCPFGSGASGLYSGDGKPGLGYGSGGSGGASIDSGDDDGGDGAPGICIVTW